MAVCTVAVFASSCSDSKVATGPTASIGANPLPAPKMFDRRILDVAGFQNLNEFIRPEVRERLDKEPVGESDEYVEAPHVSEPSTDEQASGEPIRDEDETDLVTRSRDLEKVKFSWARKKFGDALAADPTLTGVIVLYADETYYDTSKMLYFIDQGRDRIAGDAGFDNSRIQVVFGGYRGTAQVELWLVPEGQSMPETKPEDKNAEAGPEN